MRVPALHMSGCGLDVTMTPMIDVVFLLLIFFVCTTSFRMAEEILPTHLTLSGSTAPERDVDALLDLERVVVQVQLQERTIRWVIGERPYDRIAQVRDVLAAVAEIDGGVPVILDVQGAVPLQHVVDLYDLCRLLGFTKIRFAASVEG